MNIKGYYIDLEKVIKKINKNNYKNIVLQIPEGLKHIFKDFVDLFEKKTKANIEAIALKRLGQPEEIGRVAVFLASEMSDYITGEHLLVTGGGVMSQ